MAELEQDIRSWTDEAVAGTDPVQADEVMRRASAHPSARRRGRAIAAVVTAAVALAVLAAIALRPDGGPDRSSVLSDGGASSSSSTSATTGRPTSSTAVSASTTTTTTSATTGELVVPTMRVAGTYQGTSTYRLFTENCTVDSVVDLTFTLSTGEQWTFHNPNCGEIDADNVFTGNGTFVVTTDDGSTFIGTEHTHVPLDDNGGPIDLKVTGGTRSFAHASGQCVLQNQVTDVLQNQVTDATLGRQHHSGSFSCDIPLGDTTAPSSTTTTVTIEP
jgi:hypothetical protein